MATIPCVCPLKADGTTRHPNGDRVTLKPKLDYISAMTVRNDIAVMRSEDPDASIGETLAVMSGAFVLVGIESWTLMDAHGKAVPVSRTAIRAFMDDHYDEALTVANEASELYRKAVIDPLLAAASKSSQPTQTTGSTSQTTGSAPVPLKRSKRSSTTTSQTDATERMSASRAGDFN
jgi:hypothetical protein